MNLTISKTILCGLIATVVVSLVLYLKPKPVTYPDNLNPSKDSSHSHSSTASNATSLTPWIRKSNLEWKLPEESIKKKVEVVALEEEPNVMPPKPSAPEPPFNYLGKMVKNGQTFIFFSDGESPIILEKGDTLSDVWRVEEIDASFVTLTYLPLNEVRQVFIK